VTSSKANLKEIKKKTRFLIKQILRDVIDITKNQSEKQCKTKKKIAIKINRTKFDIKII